MWLQTIVIILPRVQETYHVPDNLIGILSSSLFAGMTLGAFFWGSYSDTKGRKGPYTLTLLFTSIFSVLSCFTRSFFTLCICMVFIGFGVGGNMPTDGALYLEFLPKKYHYLLTFMSIFFSLGAVLASFLGYVILPCEEACDRWRTLLFVASIITFVMLTLRSFLIQLPESPKFLLNHGRIEETLSVLQKIAKINGTQVHINKDELKTREQIEDESTPLVEEKEKKSLQALKELMSPKWRRTTVFVWFLWTFTCIGFTTFNVFLPKYLQATHDDPIKPDQSQVYWDYMIYSLVGVPGSIIASSFIETRLGRKGTMALSAFGSSIALLVFSNTQSRSIMVASSSSVSFLGTLLYAVIYGYTPETFETSVRGTAIGTASALGRIAGIISPVLGGSLFLIDTSLPLYVSIIAYSMAGISILLLP
ncbi:major facilitator superfamily domain-containing protein [Sporodiniella umbellata]|nr:major facilitator superfamily domain-containing protein [Sporodiniella umbellata]